MGFQFNKFKEFFAIFGLYSEIEFAEWSDFPKHVKALILEENC
jgi:hypothetical protein